MLTFEKAGEYTAFIQEFGNSEPPLAGFRPTPEEARADLYKAVSATHMRIALQRISVPRESLASRINIFFLRVKPKTEVETVTLEGLIARAS